MGKREKHPIDVSVTQAFRLNRIVRGRFEPHGSGTRASTRPPRAPSVLLVQELGGSLRAASAILEAAEYTVSVARTIEQASSAASHFDVAIVDLVLSDGSGIEVLAHFTREAPKTRTIVLIEHGSRRDAASAFRAGAAAELLAPFHATELLEVVGRACRDSMQAETQGALAASAVALERFASIGRSSASLIHDIANPVAAVVGNLEYVRGQIVNADVPADLVAAIEDARNAAERLAVLVRTTGARFRSGTTMAEHAVDDLIRDALASAVIPPDVHIETTANPKARVRGDGDLLARAIMNIVVNAVAAVVGRKKRNVEIRVNHARDRVTVTIADTGLGIPPDILPRIFDPFFTTKSERGGTGIGLSETLATISAHHGEIEVASDSSGTVFEVTLPAA